jgi:type IV secretion system protein VirB6
MSCVPPPTGPTFLGSTLANLDCQAQSIGEAGYQALASPGSPLSIALTALLAIFVATIGLRFLSGRPLGVDEWISAALKVGFVLVLAASWPAYKTIVYDVVLKAPAELFGSIGKASALPGSEGGLTARLQGVDNGITALVVAGSGNLDIASRRPAGAVVMPVSDDTALGYGKTLFVSSIIGSFGTVRLAGALFLALAPLFAGFLLFEATRFLFFGWLRSLIAVAIGSLGLAIVLGVELAIIEPWLSQVLALRAAKVATLSAPFELLAMTLAFSLAMLGVFAFALRIAFASAAITKIQAVIERSAGSSQNETAIWRSTSPESSDTVGERTRAQMIAQSLRHTFNRDAQGMMGASAASGAPNRTPETSPARGAVEPAPHIPLGRSYQGVSRRVTNQSLKRKPII